MLIRERFHHGDETSVRYITAERLTSEGGASIVAKVTATGEATKGWTTWTRLPSPFKDAYAPSEPEPCCYGWVTSRGTRHEYDCRV